MIDFGRLVALFESAIGLKDEVIAVIDPHVTPELADTWQKVKDAANDPANLDLARKRVAEGLAAGFQTLTEGHGEPGKHSVHAG